LLEVARQDRVQLLEHRLLLLLLLLAVAQVARETLYNSANAAYPPHRLLTAGFKRFT
jgi:hypothetical protein